MYSVVKDQVRICTNIVLQVTETASSLGMSEEEFKQHQRMKRLEAEAQEEVREENASHLMFDLMLFWSPGETDSCRPARGQDEEAAPPSSSSTKGIRLPSKPKNAHFLN